MTSYPPDPPDWDVLISLEHRDGRAAICRDPDESLWLVGDLDDLSDTEGWDDQPPEEDDDWDPREEFGDELLDYEVAGMGTAVDHIVALGGRMPPGAERVEAFDDVGNAFPVVVGEGVWLAAAQAPWSGEHAVRFLGAGGVPIERPLPPQVEVAELADVGEACPICGASQWQLVSVPDEGADAALSSPSQEWWPGRRAARCGQCGYHCALPSDPIQNFVIPPPQGDPDDRERKRQERLGDAWQRATEGLGTAPIGLAGGSVAVRRIVGWGGGSGREPITDITLHHAASHSAEDPWISVTTSAEPLAEDGPLSPDRLLEDNLVGALGDRWRDGGLEFDDQAALREHLRRREVEAQVRALPRRRIDIPIDGRNVGFLVIGDDTEWAGYGEWGAVTLTVVARGIAVEGVELEPAQVTQYLSD